METQETLQQTVAANGRAGPHQSQSLEALVRVLDAELAVTLSRHERETIGDEPATPELMIRFSVNGIIFAVTADQMIEIEAVPPLTFVPRVAPAVCGLANLRGDVIVVLDLARHLDAENPTTGDQTRRRMIVVRNACLGHPGGVIVDRVFGISPFDRQRMNPPASTLPKPVTPFVIGTVSVDEQEIAVIDLQAFTRSAEAGAPWADA